MRTRNQIMPEMVLLLAFISTGAVIAEQQDRRKLSGEEIRQIFADVEDHAVVADSKGITAVNYWYSDGRFINRWRNSSHSRAVTGTWRAHKHRRCITVMTGLPERIGRAARSPIYQQGNVYLSINSDGSIHGRHSLLPMDLKTN